MTLVRFIRIAGGDVVNGTAIVDKRTKETFVYWNGVVHYIDPEDRKAYPIASTRRNHSLLTCLMCFANLYQSRCSK